MSVRAGWARVLMILAASTARAQAPADSTLATKPITLDSLATSTQAQAQHPTPGTVFAAIGILIGAGLLVVLLYNLRSK